MANVLKIDVEDTDWGGGNPIDIQAVLNSAALELWRHLNMINLPPIIAYPCENVAGQRGGRSRLRGRQTN